MQTLFKYCPDALLEKDTETGIYAFILVACAPQPTDREDAEKHIVVIFSNWIPFTIYYDCVRNLYEDDQKG
jgi:hypothetical protein